jgi:N-acetylglucosaminyldiphosphoundecaprenol N-acetyl-beta-D-mannosaminyltransferase
VDRNGGDSNILGVPIRPIDVSTLHQRVFDAIRGCKHILILNVNAHCMNLSQGHRWLRALLRSADCVFCDGAGVALAARFLGIDHLHRITYADWTWQLAAFAEPRGFTFYFLGARPGVAEKAAARLKERHPDLQIVGTHHGYFDKTTGSPENEVVVQAINAVKPNILIVGFGMPVQERWLMENWDRIDANVALTAGAMFDYISGELRRGPRWMTDHGLEWLARLIIEPRRLWKRYLIGNPLFLWRVLKQRFGLLRLPEDV